MSCFLLCWRLNSREVLGAEVVYGLRGGEVGGVELRGEVVPVGVDQITFVEYFGTKKCAGSLAHYQFPVL